MKISRKKLILNSLIGALGIGVSSFIAKLFLSNQRESTKIMNPSSIKSIVQMGFQWQTADPFLFCVHHEDFYPKGNAIMGPNSPLSGRNIGQDFTVKDGFRMYHGEKIPGFPSHPHRGFETVTVVRSGVVDHSDSMGAVGRYSNGDVQWMTAGSGVQHSEMFPLLSEEKENTLELFQIWLNLPKKNKMVNPHFTMLWNESIPKLEFKDKNQKSTFIELIAGKIGDTSPPLPPPDSWAADPENSVQIWIIKMQAGASWKLPAHQADLNRNLYFYRGTNLQIEGQSIPEYHKTELESHHEISLFNASLEEIQLLLLEARPIKEPVVQYGPFVMNTRQEIEETFADFQRTQFGGWPWKSSEPVHDRKQGRFAKHANGKEEFPSA
ncbi:MAG: pirin family protein [Leptospira sp.]|nr:pirin family protein [Leptospira sp.]